MTVPMNAGGPPGTGGRRRATTPLRPDDPRWFGEFRTDAVLGQGGMGRVFLGRAKDGRPVAIKAVRAELARDEGFRARFRREAASARQVPSYATAEILAADPDAPIPYLVTEYIDGPDLKQLVTAGGPLRGADLHQLAVACATALRGIHGAGIMHRDLKPANVLLSRFGPRVIDFGIARAPDATRITEDGTAVGTPAYMAPEQLRNEAGPASDIFAWGGVMLFAATGRRPFQGDSLAAMVGQIMTGEPDLDGMPGRLRPVVEAALRKEAAARPTAADLLEMLNEPAEDPVLATRNEAVPAPRAEPLPDQFTRSTYVPPKARSRNRRGPVAAFLIPILVAGAGAGWLARQSQHPGLEVTAVKVEADDTSAGCDDEVDVGGTFTTNGGTGELTYQWWRSDQNAPDPPRSQAAEAGRKQVTVHLLWGLHGTGRHKFTATLTVLGGRAMQDSVTVTYSCRR